MPVAGDPNPGQPAGPSQQAGQGVARRKQRKDRGVLSACVLSGIESGRVAEQRSEECCAWKQGWRSTQQGNHSEEDHFASETSAEIAWKSCKAIQPPQSSLCEGFAVLIAGVIIRLDL